MFIDQQRKRISILNELITNFDDGRSKNFYCISCTLLPLDKLHDIIKYIENLDESLELKEKNRRIKGKLKEMAESLKIELNLNNKK